LFLFFCTFSTPKFHVLHVLNLPFPITQSQIFNRSQDISTTLLSNAFFDRQFAAPGCGKKLCSVPK
jgi:hypothetical protein